MRRVHRETTESEARPCEKKCADRYRRPSHLARLGNLILFFHVNDIVAVSCQLSATSPSLPKEAICENDRTAVSVGARRDGRWCFSQICHLPTGAREPLHLTSLSIFPTPSKAEIYPSVLSRRRVTNFLRLGGAEERKTCSEGELRTACRYGHCDYSSVIFRHAVQVLSSEIGIAMHFTAMRMGDVFRP